MEEIANKTEPFFDDLLYRKNLAENFKKVLLGTDLNVFSVTAPWGSGKTYFIENLVKLMGEDSINVLYNAWESDFYDNPLIPLLVELFNKIENLYEKSDLEQDIVAIKNVFKNLSSKLSFQTGVNFNVVNFNVTFDPSKKMIDSEYIELKNLIEKFRANLQIIQEKLNKKIIIFIDELDRCHPMYTIKTLEIIKHFFGIPNVIFVLSVDKTQIENSVRTILGVNIGEENGYLRKFIDAEFSLCTQNTIDLIKFHVEKVIPKLNRIVAKDAYGNDVPRFYVYNHLGSYFSLFELFSNLIFEISNILEFKPRDIERLFNKLSLYLDTFMKNGLLILQPSIILIALLLYSEQEFDNYVNNTSSKIVDLINHKFPYFAGLFTNKYSKEYEAFYKEGSCSSLTLRQNVIYLVDFLGEYGIKEVKEQQKFLHELLVQLKFMNNFNSL